MENNTFGKFLRARRKQCGLSQYQLGSLLNVSDRAVSKWENDLAKPKSQLLYRLSVILGVTVDELLAGGEHAGCKRTGSLTEERQEFLWNKAYNKLMELYAGLPPIETVSRFEIERLAFMNTDMLLFFDLLSQISESALKKGYPIQQEGGIGASYVAYLLGASDVNPLPAHYYCPICKRIEFVPEVSDGWVLDRKYCPDCHSLLARDGHNIPFEVYRHVIGKNTGFDLVVSRYFYEEAEERILHYFGNDRIAILNPPSSVTANRNLSQMVTYAIQSQEIPEECVLNSYEEYYNAISDKPYINLIFRDDYEKYIALRKQVNVSEEKIDFLDDQVQQALCKGGINEILNLGLGSFQQFLARFPIKNIGDAMRLYGMALNVSLLSEREVNSYVAEQKNLPEGISYRDDVYLHICSQMRKHGYLENGFAYRVMDQTRKGIYYHNGMDGYIRKLLLDIGVSQQYITCLKNTAYLLPKTQGIIQVRYMLTTLWYKIYYPQEFLYTIGEDINDSA